MIPRTYEECRLEKIKSTGESGGRLRLCRLHQQGKHMAFHLVRRKWLADVAAGSARDSLHHLRLTAFGGNHQNGDPARIFYGMYWRTSSSPSITGMLMSLSTRSTAWWRRMSSA